MVHLAVAVAAAPFSKSSETIVEDHAGDDAASRTGWLAVFGPGCEFMAAAVGGWPAAPTCRRWKLVGGPRGRLHPPGAAATIQAGSQVAPARSMNVARDTSAAATEVLFAMLRSKSPLQKLEMLARCQAMGRSLVQAGIRAQHPDISDRELRFRWGVRLYGRETMVRAFGGDPEQGP